MFVFVDETGCDARNCICRFGYSLQGLRAESHVLLAMGQRISAVTAIDCNGLVEVYYIVGT